MNKSISNEKLREVYIYPYHVARRSGWANTGSNTAKRLLGALALMATVACGVDTVDGGAGQASVATTQQAVLVDTDLEIEHDEVVTVGTFALPDAGEYSVSYELRRDDPNDEVVLSLLSGADEVLGMVTVPAGATLNANGSIERCGTVLPCIFATHVATLSTSQTIKVKVEIDDGAGAVTIDRIRLQPLRKTNFVDSTTHSFESATDPCASCHFEQFAQWRSSMMGYSSISPPIHSLELTENHVDRPVAVDSTPAMGLGRLARNAASPLDGPHAESGLFCQRCHAPGAVYTDVYRVFDAFDFNLPRGTFPDSHRLLRQISGADPLDTALLRVADFDGDGTSGTFFDEFGEGSDEVELLRKQALVGTQGITCSVCHSINGINRDSNDPNLDPENVPEEFTRPQFEEGIANAAFRVVHNDEGSEGRVNFGPYDDWELNAFHPAGKAGGDELVRIGTDGVARRFIQSGEVCGTCHDVRVPFPDEGPLGDFTVGTLGPDDEPYRRVENLFTEWRDGPWNNNNVPYEEGITTGAFTNPAPFDAGTAAKLATTCQDCHMSTYVTDDAALPRQYDEDIIGSGGTTPKKRANHRFIGVDRFLTHDEPNPNSDPTMPDTDLDELLPFDISQGTSALSFSADFLGIAENEERDLREILLQKAIDFEIEHVGPVQAGQLPIRISVENVGAGHNIPSGLSQERQIWIELEVLDENGDNVFTSGYLNRIEGPDAHSFVLDGPTRYDESYCGMNEGENEPHCDLDFFRVQLGPFLDVIPGTLEPGEDEELRNYQNGFTLDGEKVFTQFIADHIVNDNALKPFEKVTEQYNVPVGLRTGPFKVNARLRFRPLPFEFLEGLRNSIDCDATDAPDPCYPSRIDEDVIEKNVVIEMEQDGCVANAYGLFSSRACSRTGPEPLSLGDGFTCAVFGANDESVGGVDVRGSTQCFGTNSNGEVGIGVGPAAVTTPSVMHLLDVTMTSLGDAHGCALLNDGTVSCWGDGTGGKLSDNDTSNHQRTAPRLVDEGLLSDVSAIASGASTTCALSVGEQPGDERVRCWGQSTSGELGDGGFNPPPHDLAVPFTLPTTGFFPLVGVESIAAGAHHYCAIAESDAGVPGSVKCWGQALGIGRNINLGVPVAPNPDAGNRLKYRTKKLAAGDNFTCALSASSEVYCWGDNTYGTLGNNTTTNSLGPVKVMLPDLSVDPGVPHPVDITAGLHHVCALMSDETVMCWGLGDNGRLGDGSLASHMQLTPVSVGLPAVTFVAAGASNTCAISAGQRFCWGANDAGQLGLGTLGGDAALPEQITTFTDPAMSGRFYYAPENEGGFGEAGCTAPPPFGIACEEVTEGTETYIDLNDNTGYLFTIQTDGGPVELIPNIGVFTGSRTMEFFVDGESFGNITSDPSMTPRPEGAELSPIGVDLPAGYHSVEFRDIGPSSLEFDINYLRVVGAASHCLNLTKDEDETDVDCGGSNCAACGAGQMCEMNSDCQSNDCEMTEDMGLRCQGEPTCDDMMQNQDETDEDCGGTVCDPCDDGEGCMVNSDCQSNNCDAGTCAPAPAGNPCAAYCSNPVPASWAPSADYQAGALGTGTTCREVTQYFDGMWCGNFLSPKQLIINGTPITACNSAGATVSPPPPQPGVGYCIQSSAGDYDYASYALWDTTQGQTPL